MHRRSALGRVACCRCAADIPSPGRREPITAELLASRNQISLHFHPPLGGLGTMRMTHRLEGDPLSRGAQAW